MATGTKKIFVYQTAYLWILLVALLGALLAGSWFLFNQGKLAAGEELSELRKLRSELSQQVNDLQNINLGYKEQLAIFERSSQIDRQASIEVRNELAALQSKSLALRKELEFYRGIVSPGDVKPGLRVQQFYLEPTQQPDRFRYSLMLVQVKRNERYVRGVMEISVEGVENGKPKSISFDDIVSDEHKKMNFKFRYFQHFEGEVVLPPHFEPGTLHIKLVPSGKGQPSGIEETIAWPA